MINNYSMTYRIVKEAIEKGDLTIEEKLTLFTELATPINKGNVIPTEIEFILEKHVVLNELTQETIDSLPMHSIIQLSRLIYEFIVRYGTVIEQNNSFIMRARYNLQLTLTRILKDNNSVFDKFPHIDLDTIVQDTIDIMRNGYGIKDTVRYIYNSEVQQSSIVVAFSLMSAFKGIKLKKFITSINKYIQSQIDESEDERIIDDIDMNMNMMKFITLFKANKFHYYEVNGRKLRSIVYSSLEDDHMSVLVEYDSKTEDVISTMPNI